MTTEMTSANSMRPQMPYFRPSSRMGHRSYEDVLPTMAELLRDTERHHTRGMKQEVCINYIQGLCQWNGKCHRIHPVDKTPFREILDKRPRNRRRVNLAQGPMFSNEPAYLSRPVQSGDNAHSVEPTNLSLTESPQLDSIFDSFSDQELRHGAGDATSKHDTSTGSWDAETGCWIMPCNAEIWESGSRVQGVFENRGMRYFLGEDDDSDKPFIEKWLLNVQECLNIRPKIGYVEIGKARAKKRPGPSCDPKRCGLWTKGHCDRGEECRALLGNQRETKSV